MQWVNKETLVSHMIPRRGDTADGEALHMSDIHCMSIEQGLIEKNKNNLWYI